MVELPHQGDQSDEISTLRLFWVGIGLMAVWPILVGFIQGSNIAFEFYLYFIGAFILCFFEALTSLFDTLSRSGYPGALVNGLGVALLAGMTLPWVTIACLPFFGTWNRRPRVLWFVQSCYAASQAICGWVFVDQNF